MPIIIRIKRGDIENLNDHVLRDGELAVSRNRVMESGPQRDETIPDFYFRVGDGTSVGGIVPGASSIGVAIQFALSAIGSHSTLLEDLTGDYWTPWLMRDFNSPYAKDYRVTERISCLTPDVWESTPNIHLGYGSVYFDGTEFELCHNGNKPYRFECHRYGINPDATSSFLNGFFMWCRCHNLVEMDSTHTRYGFGIRSACVLEKDSTATERVQLWSYDAIVSNDSTETQVDGGCFRAGIVNNPENYIENIGRLKNWYGFQCNYMYNTRWYEENDATTSYIRNYFGFYIHGQDDNFIDGHAYGLYALELNSGPGDGIDPTDNPDTEGWDTTGSGVTRFVNGIRIGEDAAKAFGVTLWYLGTDDTPTDGTKGAASATAFIVNTIGHKDYTDISRGLYIQNIYSKGISYGSLIDTVYSNSDSTGIDGDLSVGYYVKNVNRSGSDVWSFGFLQKTSTGTNEFDKHACFGAVDVDCSVAGSTLYGVYLKDLAKTNNFECYGVYIDNIGNNTTSYIATGIKILEVHTLDVGNAETMSSGIWIENIFGSISGSPGITTGLNILQIENYGLTYGISIENVISSGNHAIGTKLLTIQGGTLATGIFMQDITAPGNVNGVNIRNISSTTSGGLAAGQTIYNISSVDECYGQRITDVLSTSEISYGQYMTGISSDSSSSYGVYCNDVSGIDYSCGFLASTIFGNRSFGLLIEAISSDLYAHGIKISNITTQGTSTNAYGIYLNDIITNDNSTEAYGLYLNGISTNGNPGYAIYSNDAETNVHMNLPTSVAGLSVGDWYVESGTVKIVTA